MIPRTFINAVMLMSAGTLLAAQPQVPPTPQPPQTEIQVRRMAPGGPGLEIGVTVRDVEAMEAERQKLTGGAVVQTVRPGSPAEKAGLKANDVVVEFDGERVRSARQLGRVVGETSPGHPVNAAIVRDGRKMTLSITPVQREANTVFDGGAWRDRLPEASAALRDRLPDVEELARLIPRELELSLAGPGQRLGIEVQELTPQLAAYFGAKHGLLVAAVNDNSPAAAAGLKVGDVVVSANGKDVNGRSDLRSAIRDVKTGDEVTLGIVRDKREVSIRTKTVDSR